MPLIPNKVEKLKVLAFKKPDRKGSSEEFIFLINPETLNSRHENKFNPSRGINTSGRTALYSVSQSDVWKLKLTLDNTLSRDHLPGLPADAADPVKEQVDNFLKACFYMDGDIHEPGFLMIEWGGFAIECRLKRIEISYSHFNSKGEPLRANLDAKFVEDIPAAKRIRLENKKSPDVSHHRIVLEGQTLSGLTKEVYGDASYYIMVAQSNQLDHFRKLEPGSALYFPPLEK